MGAWPPHLCLRQRRLNANNLETPRDLHLFSGKLWAISHGGEKQFLQNVFVTIYINVMTEEMILSQSCLRKLLDLKLPITKNDFFHSIMAEHLKDDFPESGNNLNNFMQTPYVEQYLLSKDTKIIIVFLLYLWVSYPRIPPTMERT